MYMLIAYKRPRRLYTTQQVTQASGHYSSCADLQLAICKQYRQHSNSQNAQSIHPELLVLALNCFLGLSLSTKTAKQVECQLYSHATWRLAQSLTLAMLLVPFDPSTVTH